MLASRTNALFLILAGLSALGFSCNGSVGDRNGASPNSEDIAARPGGVTPEKSAGDARSAIDIAPASARDGSAGLPPAESGESETSGTASTSTPPRGDANASAGLPGRTPIQIPPADPNLGVPAGDATAGGTPTLEGATRTPSGLQFLRVTKGSGEAPERGAEVEIRYTLWGPGAKESGVGPIDENETLRFTLGIGQVLRGLDEAVGGMLPGEKRQLILPPHLAYGQRGRADKGIAPNSPLTFEVELLSVNSP